MIYNKIIITLLRSEITKSSMKGRHALLGIHCTSRYNTNTVDKKNKKYDEFDKPIKFSTSKAATWPAGYGDEDFNRPWYQGIVVSLSVFVFYVYFTVFREENDIDQKMVENIPIEVQEQIYGKRVKKGE